MAALQPSLAATILVSTCVTAVFLHLTLFRCIEIDRHPVSIAAIIIAAYFALAASLQYLSQEYQSPLWAHLIAFLTVSCFNISTWTSMLIYRAFFHPLRRFPGPFGARLTKFWSLQKVLQSGIRWYQVSDKLHREYGDYVRTGPRELLIFDPAAITPVLGVASKTNKGPFYDCMETSLNTTRDKEFRRKRRKIWDNAFKQSLMDYGPRIEEFTDSILVRIRQSLGKPVIVNELVIHYSYDVMSALAFGNPMGFVKGDSNEIAKSVLQNIQSGVDAIGLFLHVPWVLTALNTFSWAIGPVRQWNLYSEKQVVLRKKMKNPKPDVFGHLIDNTEDNSRGRSLINSEARLIIAAGSDTTSAALTIILVHLALYPEWLDKLREEVDPALDSSSFHCSQPLPVLDAIINECLRLYPPIMFGSQRETPPEGLMVNNTYIPGNTIVSIPYYQIGRDERSFVRADKFLPERWYLKPEWVLNKTAFMPFLTGPYSCVGKNLAMMEMRSLIAKTAHELDIAFPVGSNFEPMGYFSRIRDHFVAGPPDQEIVFTQRKV